jgi:hypothetical protein
MTDTTLAERRSSLQGILKPPPFCNDSTTASSARCGLMAAAPLSVDFEIGRPLNCVGRGGTPAAEVTRRKGRHRRAINNPGREQGRVSTAPRPAGRKSYSSSSILAITRATGVKRPTVYRPTVYRLKDDPAAAEAALAYAPGEQSRGY